MIVILTGAQKNVGDYLIGKRARKLLREFVDPEILELSRFERLDDNIDLINSASSLFLAGGPAYAKNIYPEIYPLTSDLDAIRVPIVPFGLGWSGRPFGAPEKFSFDKESRCFLDRVHDRIQFSSCRDDVTLEILQHQGYENVIMTGCPVWYDLDSIGEPLITGDIQRIVFTTPASPALIMQNFNLMKELRRFYPDSEIVCSFHRGILPDRHTSLRYGMAYTVMAASASVLGFKVVDASYSLENISFYKDFDMHVGYRVHAHLDFLSRRKPSILVNEDGRGLGMVRSLGLPELNYNDPAIDQKFRLILEKFKAAEFDDLHNAVSVIDSTFSDMRLFLESI